MQLDTRRELTPDGQGRPAPGHSTHVTPSRILSARGQPRDRRISGGFVVLGAADVGAM